MSHRKRLVAFALASLLVPALASAAIVQKWASPQSTWVWMDEFYGDLDGDNHLDLVTLEPQAGNVVKFGIRSGSTGALLAQTAGTYQSPNGFWLANVDADNDYEILFSDQATGKINCLEYTVGSSTLTSRFSYVPTPAGVPTRWEFVDFDGNGHLYLVFKDEAPGSTKYYVRDYNGVLVTTIDLGVSAPSGNTWTCRLRPDDWDGDGRQELMIDYYGHFSSEPDHSVLYVWESNAPGPAQPAASQRTALRPMHIDAGGGSLATQPLRLPPRAIEPKTVDGSR